MFILGTILFILAFVAVPGIGLSFLSYGLIYDFDDLRNEMGNMSNEEFLILTQENATDLCIFEGSWEKGNVSDVDGKFKEFYTDQNEPESWYIKLKNKILGK